MITDNEIIKALKCCAGGVIFCKDCAFSYRTPSCCQQMAAKQSIDLINRQKAEIEELEAEIDKQYEQAKADILGNMSDGGTSCHWCIGQHQAEAVKEFAERLKEKGMSHYFDDTVLAVSIDELDNLVKEMVGEENG